MAKGYTPIAKVEKGGTSLVAANYANEIIRAVNILGGVKISPIANIGEAVFGEPGLVLDFAALDGRLRKLEALLYVNGTPDLTTRVANIENRLANANITANGSCSGNNITINISLNI